MVVEEGELHDLVGEGEGKKELLTGTNGQSYFVNTLFD